MKRRKINNIRLTIIGTVLILLAIVEFIKSDTTTLDTTETKDTIALNDTIFNNLVIGDFIGKWCRINNDGWIQFDIDGTYYQGDSSRVISGTWEILDKSILIFCRNLNGNWFYIIIYDAVCQDNKLKLQILLRTNIIYYIYREFVRCKYKRIPEREI